MTIYPPDDDGYDESVEDEYDAYEYDLYDDTYDEIDNLDL